MPCLPSFFLVFPFHCIDPLGKFSLKVAMFICVSVCNIVRHFCWRSSSIRPPPKNFFWSNIGKKIYWICKIKQKKHRVYIKKILLFAQSDWRMDIGLVHPVQPPVLVERFSVFFMQDFFLSYSFYFNQLCHRIFCNRLCI